MKIQMEVIKLVIISHPLGYSRARLTGCFDTLSRPTEARIEYLKSYIKWMRHLLSSSKYRVRDFPDDLLFERLIEMGQPRGWRARRGMKNELHVLLKNMKAVRLECSEHLLFSKAFARKGFLRHSRYDKKE